MDLYSDFVDVGTVPEFYGRLREDGSELVWSECGLILLTEKPWVLCALPQ